MVVGQRQVYDVYGAGGHAQVVIDVLHAHGIRVRRQYNDSADNQHPASTNVRPGVRVLGHAAFPDIEVPLVIAVGRNAERAELAQLVTARFGQAVHPSAIVAASASIGEGSVVLHGVIVQAHARVGRHVLLNTAASVDHDCVVEDYAHISPHATLCGNVHVGEGTHVGAGAVILPNLRVGRWCRVGAGAVVIRDLPDHVTAVGNPARILPGSSGEQLPDLVLARPAQVPPIDQAAG